MSVDFWLVFLSAVICSRMSKTQNGRNSRWRCVFREMWSWVGWITSPFLGEPTGADYEMISHYLGKDICIWSFHSSSVPEKKGRKNTPLKILNEIQLKWKKLWLNYLYRSNVCFFLICFHKVLMFVAGLILSGNCSKSLGHLIQWGSIPWSLQGMSLLVQLVQLVWSPLTLSTPTLLSFHPHLNDTASLKSSFCMWIHWFSNA